jgi:hypothetical protein
MRRLTALFESVPSGVFRLNKLWILCCMALFGMSSLLGCSSDESHPPDCEVRTEEQALPQCIGLNPFAEEFSDECEFYVEISNGCDSPIDAVSYCDYEDSPDGRVTCPADREVAVDATETVPLGPISATRRIRREAAIEFIGMSDDESESSDKDVDLQPAVSLTLVYDRIEADDVHGLYTTTDVSRTRGNPSWVLGVVVLIGVVVPVRRRTRSGRDT